MTPSIASRTIVIQPESAERSVRLPNAKPRKPTAAAPRRAPAAVVAKRVHTARGQRTRERIKQAAEALLDRGGYRRMRLSDIAAEAEIPISLIYRYFTGKRELVLELLSENTSANLERMFHGPEVTAPYDILFVANREMVRSFGESPGVRRCLFHLNEDEPEFYEIYREATLQWNRRIAKAILKRMPGAGITEGQALAVAYLLAGMVDYFLMERYVYNNAELAEALPTDDDVATFLSVMWHRALYLENPPAAKLGVLDAFERLRLPTPAGRGV
jgi:AcrR family transcriptional regulator